MNYKDTGRCRVSYQQGQPDALHHLALDAGFTQDVIWSDARLTAVDKLAPGHSPANRVGTTRQGNIAFLSRGKSHGLMFERPSVFTCRQLWRCSSCRCSKGSCHQAPGSPGWGGGTQPPSLLCLHHRCPCRRCGQSVVWAAPGSPTHHQSPLGTGPGNTEPEQQHPSKCCCLTSNSRFEACATYVIADA